MYVLLQVTTYKHATRALEMAADDDDDGSQHSYTLNSSNPAAGVARDSYSSRPPRKQLMETWLLLEFCNRGCISDAVEKGWFRQQPQGPTPSGVSIGDGSVESSFSGGLTCPAPDMSAILATAREIAAAMSYLHHKNMLHGDLTGNNVLLTAAPAEKRGYTAKVGQGCCTETALSCMLPATVWRMASVQTVCATLVSVSRGLCAASAPNSNAITTPWC